ncbi:hypothetical protein IRP63_04840 [Clostridium botulinum]|uniref:Heme-binding protein Shr-like Hb-interacting domain-containing protein n=1 Tax=Clostridium botulinum C/D str. DC5 TaxID=1443128 RepID=A0A0A0IGZ8_CLOBO|nr:hypothetical protein [Clostridium botulinum]KGM94405.1 hypothetical protein Z956_07785 [Clostridium botulinum D str. CCUG 7971]KGN00228.1 hypothetical protein Z955_04325 [Clostridium botulinum C/D str. DC5]KOC50621.1 hypothetical protein ADU88_01715 [Clostridium botulinum]MCD3233486.1 hypothetical protein [Clostridium botulinum D/C]MCD3239236.1 hypothetical protein [Clostridium botulinum D/C]
MYKNKLNTIEPPIINPDNNDNDMEHYIVLTFIPNVDWSKNIEDILVENSIKRQLQSHDFKIYHEEGKIIIYNVKFQENGAPIYQDILQPGNNTISIISNGYKIVKVVQYIKAIQVIEVKNGHGKAITRIEDRGKQNLYCKVISDSNKYNIDTPGKIKIL